MRVHKFLAIVILLFTIVSGANAQTEPKVEPKKDPKVELKKEHKTGRPPVIVVPGLIGSELVNSKTGEVVWFDLGRSKDDDLRLPISADLKANVDNLVPRDILREIQIIRFTPKIEIYQKLIDTLKGDGYAEGRLDFPEAGGDVDTFYVFAYDWRLDNVVNARILIEKLDNLRAKLNRPDLKVSVVAHSMGGLITRYAAMYGKDELVARSPRPTWKGANYFSSISLVATPNAGATSTLDSMVNGYSLFGSGKINLPFVQNLSRSDLFTLQSMFQLLPHAGSLRAFDENLKPMKVDIFSPTTWEKFGWTVYSDKDFDKKFTAEEQKSAPAYFRAVLLRAKQFQAALDALPQLKSAVPIYYLGAECRDTLDGVIIRREKDEWKTEFSAVSYTTASGRKITKEETQKVLVSPGDGVVPKRSLLSSFTRLGLIRNKNSTFVLNSATEGCAEHNRLTGNDNVTRNLLDVLNGRPFEAEAVVPAKQ